MKWQVRRKIKSQLGKLSQCYDEVGLKFLNQKHEIVSQRFDVLFLQSKISFFFFWQK